MNAWLSTLFQGKITYGSALGLIVTGVAGWYFGLMSLAEVATLILTGTGIAGARRAIGNSNNELMRLILQTAIEAQRNKAAESVESVGEVKVKTDEN
ncbi:hypothetical protein C4587_01865 [Candidatus Parcubacteria bacterium]|nr:MAG: hypothetical protein C4587_01865 [Candidatus Parcubacteria bacterium]